MLGLKERWLELCLDLSLEPARLVVGTRKILRNQTWVISGDDWRTGEFDPEEVVGYNNWQVKRKQLHRYYVNPEELERAIAKFKFISKEKDKFDSVNMTLKNEHKSGWTSQDHCMASMIISYWPKSHKGPANTEIDVYYRTTEVAKKFVADLALFREDIFPHFEPISRIRFVFSTLNMSVAFTPAIFLSAVDPVAFMTELQRSDERHWRRICTYLVRYLCDDDVAMKFKQHDRVKKRLARSLEDSKKTAMIEYLHENAAALGPKFAAVLAENRNG